MTQLTPMLQQYYTLKSQYPGCILLFRLGDFYEMFDEDAQLASRLLQITLTSREAGRDERIPMCGVPHHSVEKYIADLIRHGHRVAVCEQVEDPKTAKGVVRREVVRVVTPGTVTEEPMLPGQENNFLVAICRHGDAPFKPSYGLAACDLSTGEFMCTQMDGDDARAMLRDEIARLRPAEVLLDPSFEETEGADCLELLRQVTSALMDVQQARYFYYESSKQRLLDHFGTDSLEGFGCAHLPLAVRAAGAIIEYLRETQKRQLSQIVRLTTYSTVQHMQIDASTRRNLELIRTLRGGEKKGSLIWVLDKTRTSMGARMLRRWVEQPLLSCEAIQERLDAVDDLVQNPELRFALQKQLDDVYDMERLMARVAVGSANGRDLLALKSSLSTLPLIQSELKNRAVSKRLKRLANGIDPCIDLCDMISSALVDDPPAVITEGGLIRAGYSEEVDKLNALSSQGRDWIKKLEQVERERTQIRSLKIGYNKVFGYYIEVTRPNLSLVPPEYQRKQTLANAERFVTPELKEKEAEVLGAQDRLIELEYQLFVDLRDRLAGHVERIQSVARLLAELDVYTSLAEVAVDRQYVKPIIDDKGELEIVDGRHPVVEATLEPGTFVPNDLKMDTDTQVIMLTGPNMAGKSTYLRQTALIVLMAQMGGFVPAKSARIGIVDRIFTRVGASDDLATGQSTFMVEMNEVANILNHATAKSLIILDEVGRGTSTFDGLSIAWAVTEYILTEPRVQAKTLFATHYHELTELEALFPRVKNYSVAVHKEGQKIVFLRRIIRGGADQSYGIEVARLAGLPSPVLKRARQLLQQLEQTDNDGMVPGTAEPEAATTSESNLIQMPLFESEHPIITALKAVDINTLTPLEALNILASFVSQAEKGGTRP